MEDKTKQPTELDNWIGWLQARIPVLKESHNVFWLKQAMEGYRSDSKENLHTDKVEPSTRSQSVPSAKEYLNKTTPEQKVDWTHISRGQVINIMESYRDLCVEQKIEELKKVMLDLTIAIEKEVIIYLFDHDKNA